MIGQAIERMPAQDLMELRAITLAMRRRAEQGESFADEDRAFHAVLFRGLDNRMLIRLIDVFWRAFDRAATSSTPDNPDPMQTWRDHDGHRRCGRGSQGSRRGAQATRLGTTTALCGDQSPTHRPHKADRT